MKKLYTKILVAGLAIAALGTISVSASAKIKSANYSNLKLYLDGKEIILENSLVSIVKDGSDSAQIYMPMRELLEYLEYDVEWKSEDNSIHLLPKNTSTNLKTSEADKRGIEIMEKSGTWSGSGKDELDTLIPIMSPEAVDKVVMIYLERHLFPKITTPQSAKQVAAVIDTALNYMTEEGRDTAKQKLATFLAD